MPGLSFEIDGKHVPVDECSWGKSGRADARGV